MASNEASLKEAIQQGPRGLYLLYGQEGYLVEQYARSLIRHTVAEDFDAFNLQRFDGQEITPQMLEEAVEALPLMAERKCVTVRDLQITGENVDRYVSLIDHLPDTCVLVLWQMTTQPDKKKGPWKTFLDRAETVGTVVRLDRKEPADIARMLVSGAKRRGCTLTGEDARYLIQQVGCDLNLLLGELDKLSALAGEGAITRDLIDRAGSKSLEAKVFDLSKAMLSGRTGDAYRLLHQLFALREDPIMVLGVLSNAYADLYRAKVADVSGASPEGLAGEFKSYKSKEWRLRNASRDARRMSVPMLRDALEILACADRDLKSTGADPRIRVEQTVAQLLERVREDS